MKNGFVISSQSKQRKGHILSYFLSIIANFYHFGIKICSQLHFVWSFCLRNPIDMSEEVMRITFGHLPSGDENGSED